MAKSCLSVDFNKEIFKYLLRQILNSKNRNQLNKHKSQHNWSSKILYSKFIRLMQKKNSY